MILIARLGKDYIPLKMDDIAVVKAYEKRACIIDKNGTRFKNESNLRQLEKKLGNHNFFRANRQTIVNINFIKSFKTLSRKGMELEIQVANETQNVHISSDRIRFFNKWIESKLL